MDRGKKPGRFLGAMNSKIYLDLKDIIREHALPFLPAKSLFRFTGVCRDWKLQISTPFFAHNQSNSFRTISGLFCQAPGDPPSFISLDPKACGVPDPSLTFLPDQVDVRASSNGLLCCEGCTGEKAFYICNPVSKQWKKLPKPNANHGPDSAIVLIFEPSLLNFVADYKLVCAFPSVDFDNGYEFEIYSSAEESWKISGEICFGNRKLLPRSGVHVKGVVYWMTKNGSSIVAFDLMKERSQLLYGSYGSSLGVMHGKLCLVSVSRQLLVVNVLSNVYSNTMVMNSNAKTWEEKLRIPLSNDAVPGGISYDQALVVFAGSDVVVVQAGRSVFSIDIKTKESAVLCSAADHDVRIIAYVNSLVYF
ncbi:hypothetical protein L1049_023676 [Liquidambar formosana]|uniref:F-box protein At3g26010-like beta-propeller domain-containing protein n=1 Tax=Liquidambar formosana TaxID=63359 RepID=A0AAP0RTW4_LIQFO